MSLAKVLKQIRGSNKQILAQARLRQEQLTKPKASLGLLEDLGNQLAAIQETPRPVITGKAVAVFAADHGISEEGVSAYPKEVTKQMLLTFLRGGAAINVLSQVHGVKLTVVDVGVAADLAEYPQLLSRNIRKGSRNFLSEPAMTKTELHEALEVGFELAEKLVAEGANLLAAGDMGIANTTAATALLATLTGLSVRDLSGRGTGLDDQALEHKIAVIERALSMHKVRKEEALELLRKVGGLELAAMTGFYLKAASLKTAIVLDGFVSHSAALVASSLKPEVKDYFFASHSSSTEHHKLRYELLGVKPLFDFSLRLGEGTGAVLAMPIIESAAAILSKMASFAEAGVSEKLLDSGL